MLSHLATNRLAIEGVSPEIDGGRFPAKAVVGAPVVIEADIFGDGHDSIDAAILSTPAVWEASGHLANFTDPLVDCTACKTRHRLDKLEDPDLCPECGKPTRGLGFANVG